jgi:hypothetical protein
VKCRGRDQAISWIIMLKHGAAGENSDSSRDWQDLQTKRLQQLGEIINRTDIAWKLKAAAIDQEGQLPQRDVGDGQLALLPVFLQGCSGTNAEARWSIGPNRGMGVSQMIRITTPLHIRDPMDHIAKGDAITQIQQPLAGLFGRVPLQSDAGNGSSAGCHLQLFTAWTRLRKAGRFYRKSETETRAMAATPFCTNILYRILATPRLSRFQQSAKTSLRQP